MAAGDIVVASFPLSLDANGPAVDLAVVAGVAGFTAAFVDILTTEIVHITGKNGVSKTVVVVVGRTLS